MPDACATPITLQGQIVKRCERPVSHDGKHAAQIGVYTFSVDPAHQPGDPVLLEWDRDA